MILSLGDNATNQQKNLYLKNILEEVFADRITSWFYDPEISSKLFFNIDGLSGLFCVNTCFIINRKSKDALLFDTRSKFLTRQLQGQRDLISQRYPIV